MEFSRIMPVRYARRNGRFKGRFLHLDHLVSVTCICTSIRMRFDAHAEPSIDKGAERPLVCS